MTYSLTLQDESDELQLGEADVAVTLDYEIDPGDPGCWRTANGDGWPATPPSVELCGFAIDDVRATCGLPRPVTADVLEAVCLWVSRELDDRWSSIEDDILLSHPSDAEAASYYEEYE